MNRRDLVLLCLLSGAAVFSPAMRAAEAPPSAAGLKSAGVGLGDARGRLKNFANLNHARAWQVVFDGGDHMVYSGNVTKRSAPEALAKYPEWRACVTDMAVALFRAELAGDKAAAVKLTKDAVVARVGKLGEVSAKP